MVRTKRSLNHGVLVLLVLGLSGLAFLYFASTKTAPVNAPIVGDPTRPSSTPNIPVVSVPGSPPSQSEPLPPVPPESLSVVDGLLASLRHANIAFNSPKTIKLDQTAQIELLLSAQKSADELIDSIIAPGDRASTRIKVATRMVARLSGPNFRITQVTPEEQAIGSIETVKWTWEIQPERPGHHNLYLTLTALLDLNGAASQGAVRTFQKTIEVTVPPGLRVVKFLASNWQWLCTTIVVPLAIVGWTRWRVRKMPDESTN